MSKNEYILTVDIGSTSIKFAEFSYPESGSMILEKHAYVQYATGTEDIDDHLKAFETHFNETVSQYDFMAKKVFMSISGQATFIRFVKLPPTSSEENKIQQLVEYEAKQNVPYPIEEVTWDYQLIGGNDNENTDINVMFAVVKNEIVEKIVKIIEKSNFKVSIVDISPTTMYNTARANGVGEDECAMILNIGGTCSTLVFIDKDHFYARTIPVAGHTITQQISREFEVSFEKAEEMKRNIGFVALGGAYAEPDSTVASTVSKIIRNVMTRLHGDINRSINVYKSQQNGKKPGRLYLSGGSSIINFTSRFLSSKLRIPVEYFNPFKIVQISDSIDKDKLADYAHTTIEVIGLGLREATTCPIEISLIPETIKKQKSIKVQCNFFIISSAIFIFSLLLILWGVSRQKNMVVDLTNSRQKQTVVAEATSKKLKKYLATFKNVKKDFSITRSYLDQRNDWFNILNTIQNCLPDNTWIVELSLSQVAPTQVITQTRRSIFGRKKIVKKKREVHKKDYSDWIMIKAHSLVIIRSKMTSAEKFRLNVLKTKSFTDKSEDIAITDFNTNMHESNNIDTFNIKIKLKKGFLN